MDEPPSTERSPSEYEEFGLFPLKALREIVTRLESVDYKDANGRRLVDSSTFQNLERMALEPQVPDSVTATVASIINHLEQIGYADKAGHPLSDSPILLALKQMNIKRLFRRQPEDALRVTEMLGELFRITTHEKVQRLKDDPAFQDLNKIIELDSRT